MKECGLMLPFEIERIPRRCCANCELLVRDESGAGTLGDPLVVDWKCSRERGPRFKIWTATENNRCQRWRKTKPVKAILAALNQRIGECWKWSRLN